MLPEMSPVIVPIAFCSTCGKLMRAAPQCNKNGRIIELIYYCDSDGCKYAWSAQTPYLIGLSLPMSLYKPPLVVEPPAQPVSTAHTTEVPPHVPAITMSPSLRLRKTPVSMTPQAVTAEAEAPQIPEDASGLVGQ